MSNTRFSGMGGFTVVWSGQVISLLGTAMTRFALVIWVWQLTEAATSIVLIGFFYGVPAVIANFFAGPLIDRWNRKAVIILADIGAGIPTIIMLLLLLDARLEVWHLYVASALAGIFGTFHSLSFSTAITTMLPKAQYARASGMISLAEYASAVGAPLLAGVLLNNVIDISGIMMLDILSFLVASTLTLFAHIPQPAPSTEAETGEETQGFWKASSYGFRHIFRSSSLTGLLLIYFAFSLFESLGYPLLAPMILARTDGNELVLGSVQSVMGIGGVVGGVLLSVWGGPRRKIHGLLIGLALTGLLGDVLMGLGRGLYAWMIAAFFLECFIPVTIGSGQAIWQTKVPPALQGRVFAARRVVTGIADPVGLLLAGLLADHIFEPAMMPGGALSESLGGLVGTGPGAGMALLFVICGVLSGLVGLLGYVFHAVRNAEDLLADHDAVTAAV